MNFKDLITPFDIMVIASGIDHHSGCKLSELIDFIDSDNLYIGFKHISRLQGIKWEWKVNVGYLIKWEAIVYAEGNRFVYDRYRVKFNPEEFSKFVRDAFNYAAQLRRAGPCFTL